MIVAVSQLTWDYAGQIGLWLVGLPLLVTIVAGYIYFQIVAEHRENQRTAGRWGLAAKNSRDTDA